MALALCVWSVKFTKMNRYKREGEGEGEKEERERERGDGKRDRSKGGEKGERGWQEKGGERRGGRERREGEDRKSYVPVQMNGVRLPFPS